MNENKGIWIGVVILVIVVALGLWWLSESQSGSTMAMATTTAATSTTGTSFSTVDENSSDVASIAANISGASQFASLLSSTGVASQISGAGPYTVFVPTDGAFSLLPSGTISSMTSAQLKRLVEYHIVSGRAIDVSAQNSGAIQALSGDALNFSDTSTNIPQVNSSIIVAEYQGSNGVVYLINGVLFPPTAATQ